MNVKIENRISTSIENRLKNSLDLASSIIRKKLFYLLKEVF
jgi:hypothetical protein